MLGVCGEDRRNVYKRWLAADTKLGRQAPNARCARLNSGRAEARLKPRTLFIPRLHMVSLAQIFLDHAYPAGLSPSLELQSESTRNATVGRVCSRPLLFFCAVLTGRV